MYSHGLGLKCEAAFSWLGHVVCKLSIYVKFRTTNRDERNRIAMRGGLATRESPLQIGKRNKGNGNVAKEKDGWNLERYLTDTEGARRGRDLGRCSLKSKFSLTYAS